MVTDYRGYAEKIIEIVLKMDGAGKEGETVLDLELAVRESTVSNSERYGNVFVQKYIKKYLT